jgi:diguanylate cyclase (GGDEF)-like protein/PAS domain S-box-containing protein
MSIELGRTGQFTLLASDTKDPGSGLAESISALRAEQIRLLYRQRGVAPVNLIVAGLTCAALRSVYPAWVLALWLGLFCLVILGRFLLQRRYRTKEHAVEMVQYGGRFFAFGAFATGSLWGLTGSIAFMTSDPTEIVFGVFILGGMMAAGIVGNAAYLPAMFGFMLPTIVPVIAALGFRHESSQIEMALMLIAFATVLVIVGRNINRSIVENIRLRIEQSTLSTKLGASQAAMATAQAIGHVGTIELDPDSGVARCSDEIYRIFGVDPVGFKPTYEALLQRVHPDDRPAVAKWYARLIVAPASLSIDHRIVMDDGTIKHLHESTRSDFSPEGRPVRLIGSVQDITERKQAELEFRFANTLLTTEMETSPDGILVVDGNKKILSFNKRFGELWKVPTKDLVGTEDIAALTKVASQTKDPEKFLTRVQYLYDHPDEAGHEKIETADGRFIDRRSAALRTATGKNLGRVWFFRDVTQETRAAKVLAYRDRLLRAVTSGAEILVKVDSLDEGMPEALRIVGQSLRVDRALVIEECPGKESPLALRYLWQRRGIQPRIKESEFTGATFDPRGSAAWRKQLTEGKPIFAQFATADEASRAMLARFQSHSTLLLPIFVRNHLWGSLGIDAVTAPRDWTDHEIETLKTFAGIAGSLIQRSEARLALQTSEERFRVFSAISPDAMVTIDTRGLIRDWNPAASLILGYSEEEAIGKQVHELLTPSRFREEADRSMKIFAATGKGGALGKTRELAARKKDGSEIAVELSIAGATLGDSWQAIGILRDITQRKLAEAQALQAARFDVLTGLANRSVFVKSLEYAIAKAQRGDKGFAVIYLDLDHFKDVNDTLGHPIGDELLKAVSDRLRSNTRTIDTVARFGGDEFAVVAADISEPADVAALADKLIKAIATPFSIQGNEIHSGASIGIDLYGPESPDAETLLSHADVALYRTKSEGRGSYRFFTEAMDLEVRTRVTLGAELRLAIESNQLFLLYQPQVAIGSGRITGLEALVRWRHPIRGLIPPDQFIPLAEKVGIVAKLGHWVLWTACRQAKSWIDAGITPVRMGVNLSALQFKTPLTLEKDIMTALAETGLPPRWLELELTETILMETSHEHSDLLSRLRQSGITIAIDDFGTGYSSLDYLRRFPVDRIKIAQNFVANLETAPGDVAIVKATIGLARELGIAIIAEGVETQAQLELLESWGCGEAQGYYFAKPLAVNEITAMLRNGETGTRPVIAGSNTRAKPDQLEGSPKAA